MVISTCRVNVQNRYIHSSKFKGYVIVVVCKILHFTYTLFNELKLALYTYKYGTLPVQCSSCSLSNCIILKDRGCAVRFIHDIKSRSLTWNYFVFELSTVWLQSSSH